MYHFALYFDLVLIIVIIVLVRVGRQIEYAEIIQRLSSNFVFVLELVETNDGAVSQGKRAK
jgi:hypothetical protein